MARKSRSLSTTSHTECDSLLHLDRVEVTPRPIPEVGEAQSIVRLGVEFRDVPIPAAHEVVRAPTYRLRPIAVFAARHRIARARFGGVPEHEFVSL